jgi:hypothetical protein
VLCRIRSIYKLVVVVAATGGVVVEVGIVEVRKVIGDVFFEWWSFGGLTADFERERDCGGVVCSSPASHGSRSCFKSSVVVEF